MAPVHLRFTLAMDIHEYLVCEGRIPVETVPVQTDEPSSRAEHWVSALLERMVSAWIHRYLLGGGW